MISTIKRKIVINKELRSKIEWACTFSNCEPKITNGNLRMVEKTNLAYVEPHKVIIKDKLYLFFNEHEYFYINSLSNKYPISQLREFIND
ncbi:MAG: hypothetical protein HUJ68_02690 [Clostridia bacterium]|nr:hypothetical protein [Clostridia bacterium]